MKTGQRIVPTQWATLSLMDAAGESSAELSRDDLLRAYKNSLVATAAANALAAANAARADANAARVWLNQLIQIVENFHQNLAWKKSLKKFHQLKISKERCRSHSATIALSHLSIQLKIAKNAI